MSALHRPALLVLVALMAVLALGLAGSALAQTDPPALGDGDWTVRDDTIIKDWDVIMLRGDLLITDGGSLTLSNSTLLFVNAEAGDHGILVDNGGTIRILSGATVGSSRPAVAFTFVVEAGCTLEIRDSFIEEVGMPAYGLRPNWREIALYIGTPDAIIEGSTFTGGLAGPFFDEGVLAPPVRNCTFENVYGIISYGVGIEDCTFHNQNIYGIVFHGGDTGYVARCTFESVFATCVNVGYEYFEPYELHPAEANIFDCTFDLSTRAIKVLDRSVSVITNCSIDGMEREGIVVGTGSSVNIRDSSVNNTFEAIKCAEGGTADLTVTTSVSIRGGSITLSGNITVGEGARLEVTDFRNLTMLSTTTAPLHIDLYEGSVLALTRGTLEIPLPSTIPGTWSPIVLGPDIADVRGALHLEEVPILDLADGYRIAELRAVRSTIPVGNIAVEELYLEECALVPDVRASSVLLTLGSTKESTDCYLIDCWLDGIDRMSNAGPWLTVRTAVVHSYDFLYGLDDMIDGGDILLAGSNAGPAEFYIWWSAHTHVRWQNHAPIVGVVVTMESQTSKTYLSTTDHHGDTERVNLLTEELTGVGGYRSHIPIFFSVNVSGLEQDTVVTNVDRPIVVDLLVVDAVPPRLLLDVPDVVATNTTKFTLSGRIEDDHSGVAFLEVSLRPADYIRVPVDRDTGRFDHSIILRKGYQSIAIRGYDTVGNRRVKVVETFYSISPPFVFIEEPYDGAWVNSDLTIISGVTETGATVELQGRVTEAVNGSFRIPAYLMEGPNLLRLNVTSLAGNHNSTQVLIYMDTIEPTLEVYDPATSPYMTQSPHHRIRGRAEAGVQVFINQVVVDDVDPDGSFITGQVSLNEGATKYTIRAIDAAGNENVTEVMFILDSQPPSLVILVNGEDANKYTGDGLLMTSAETVQLTVNTDEDAILLLNGETIAMDGTKYTLDHSLVVGFQTITVRVEDPAGNAFESDPIRIEVDWTPPQLSLDASMPVSTEEALLSLRGRTEPNCTVTVNGVRISVDSRGTFVKNFLLNEGSNSIVVLSTDRYGQTTMLVYDVTMVAPEPEPWADASSWLPLMLGITIALIIVEVVALQLWWRRKRDPHNGSD